MHSAKSSHAHAITDAQSLISLQLLDLTVNFILPVIKWSSFSSTLRCFPYSVINIDRHWTKLCQEVQCLSSVHLYYYASCCEGWKCVSVGLCQWVRTGTEHLFVCGYVFWMTRPAAVCTDDSVCANGSLCPVGMGQLMPCCWWYRTQTSVCVFTLASVCSCGNNFNCGHTVCVWESEWVNSSFCPGWLLHFYSTTSDLLLRSFRTLPTHHWALKQTDGVA